MTGDIPLQLFISVPLPNRGQGIGTESPREWAGRSPRARKQKVSRKNSLIQHGNGGILGTIPLALTSLRSLGLGQNDRVKRPSKIPPPNWNRFHCPVPTCGGRRLGLTAFGVDDFGCPLEQRSSSLAYALRCGYSRPFSCAPARDGRSRGRATLVALRMSSKHDGSTTSVPQARGA